MGPDTLIVSMDISPHVFKADALNFKKPFKSSPFSKEVLFNLRFCSITVKTGFIYELSVIEKS